MASGSEAMSTRVLELKRAGDAGNLLGKDEWKYLRGADEWHINAVRALERFKDRVTFEIADGVATIRGDGGEC
jgi:hypothetical protein